MNFPPANPQRFMLESIPLRFGNLTGEEFGAFIRYLFQLDGFEVLPVVSSKDLGIHMQAIKDGIVQVILPILTPIDEKVDVSDIKRAIQATALYKANQPWIITTASFSTDAKAMALHADVELWDWEALYDAICHLFFDGKSHLDFPVSPLQPQASIEGDSASALRLKAKWMALEGLDSTWFNLQLSLTNPTTNAQYIHLELPAFIDSKSTQTFADQWGEEEFVSGMLYGGATVRTNAQFKVSKLGERPPGGRVALTYHERQDLPITYHVDAHVKGEACYIVTYCYGRDSDEYRHMTQFRDERLGVSPIGRMVIRMYYFLSPALIILAARNRILDRFLRKSLRRIVKIISQN